MGNHIKHLFWPPKFTNPNCTLCPNNDKDTWPHMLFTCKHKFLKGLIITRHNATTHQLSYLLRSCIHTRHHTFKNFGKIDNQSQEIMPWRLPCSCLTTKCIPTPRLTIHIIKFTFTHDRYTTPAIETKIDKYNPLIEAIKTQGWLVITARVHGSIDTRRIELLGTLNIPPTPSRNQQKPFTTLQSNTSHI